MTGARKRPAKYSDLEALPEHVVGEIIAGDLHASPRPATPHARTTLRLGGLLDLRLRPKGRKGRPPSGWWFFVEPELHFGADVLVPDIAGWRAERVPVMPDVVGITTAPDWACEVLSPSTRRLDRVYKLPIFAREGVKHAWLIDPRDRTLEVYASTKGQWLMLLNASDDDVVRAPPFESLRIRLADLWLYSGSRNR